MRTSLLKKCFSAALLGAWGLFAGCQSYFEPPPEVDAAETSPQGLDEARSVLSCEADQPFTTPRTIQLAEAPDDLYRAAPEEKKALKERARLELLANLPPEQPAPPSGEILQKKQQYLKAVEELREQQPENFEEQRALLKEQIFGE